MSNNKPDTSMPKTAREVLAAFYPDHGWHTATFVANPSPDSIKVSCSCGVAVLITETTAKRREIPMKQVREALRNVPLEGSGVQVR